MAAAQSDWQRLATSTAPAPRTNLAMAYHAARDRVVLFGGAGAGGATLGDTWEFDGQQWRRRATAATPPARRDAKMAYDPSTSSCLMFGGVGANGQLLDDTWVWDGVDWSRQTPATVPPARAAHSMAFDGVNLRVTLFGGLGGFGAGFVAFSDTWEWSASAADWIRIPAPSAPSRWGAAMAQDPATNGVLLYGGSGTLPCGSDDTWSFDGTDWTRLQGQGGPGARCGAQMAPDAYRARVVLTGGAAGGGDTWEWDGVDWIASSATVSPGLRTGAGLVYDSARRRLVHFGGGAAVTLNDTWAYVMTRPALVAPYHFGCPGSAGLPLLTSEGLPWLGDSFGWTINGLPTGRLSVLAIGDRPAFFDLTPLGAPGCAVVVGALFAAPLVVVAGQASYSVTLGVDPGLLGVQIDAQSFTADPAANALGISASRGVASIIGQR